MFEENKNTNWKSYIHPYVHCNIIYNSQDGKMDKENARARACTNTHTHTHTMEHYTAIKKKNLVICHSTDEPWGHKTKMK